MVDLPLATDDSSGRLTGLLASVNKPETIELDCAACTSRVEHDLSERSVQDCPSSVLFHVRRSDGGAKSRSICWFDRIYQLRAAIVHVVLIMCLIPVITSLFCLLWTCLDDGRCYTLTFPSHRHWHLYRDATLLMHTLLPNDFVAQPRNALALPSIDSDACAKSSGCVVHNDRSGHKPPLQIVLANLTSWFSGWPQLLSDFQHNGSCIWLLSETHLSVSAARACLGGLHRLGSDISPKGSTRYNRSGFSTLAGVAVISTLPLREVAWKTESLKQLAQEGRLLHVTCAVIGSQPLHVWYHWWFHIGVSH